MLPSGLGVLRSHKIAQKTRSWFAGVGPMRVGHQESLRHFGSHLYTGLREVRRGDAVAKKLKRPCNWCTKCSKGGTYWRTKRLERRSPSTR